MFSGISPVKKVTQFLAHNGVWNLVMSIWIIRDISIMDWCWMVSGKDTVLE